MNYRKISLNAHGTKGAAVEYLEANSKGLMELTKKFPRNPVHIGLQKLFNDLRPHLLNICGIVNDTMDLNVITQHVIETTVDSIEMDGSTITIKGEKLRTSDKYITLKTYKLEAEDGYELYDDVFNLINAICDEVTEYMSGNKKADDVEAAMQWLAMKGSVKIKEDGKTKTLTIDDIKEFSPEKLKEWASALLENNFGSVVLHSEDMDLSQVDTEGAIEELKTEFEVTDEAVEIEVGDAKVKKEKKEKVIASVGAVQEEEESNEEQF